MIDYSIEEEMDEVRHWLYRTAREERKMIDKVELILRSLDQNRAFDARQEAA